MIYAITISEAFRIEIGQIVETRDSKDKIEVDLGMNKIIEEDILEVMQGHIKIMKDKIVEESTETITQVKVIAEVEIGTGLEKVHFQKMLVVIELIGVQATVGLDQDQEQV